MRLSPDITENLDPLIASCFEPGLRYLTAKNDARWVNGAWFTSEAKTFFAQLSPETAELVLDNLTSDPRIDTHTEWILAISPGDMREMFGELLGRRIREDQPGPDREDRYEAIPYQFHRLPKVLLKMLPRPFESRAACTRGTIRCFSFAAVGYSVRCVPHFRRTWLTNSPPCLDGHR